MTQFYLSSQVPPVHNAAAETSQFKRDSRSARAVLTKAAILCGGQGTRLRPLTNYFQKTMIPIGLNKRPLLEYIVKLLVYHGIEDVVLLTNYRGEEIMHYFGDGAKFGARIAYSKDPRGSKGTANAIMHAIKNGTVGKFDDLIVYYGDVLSALDAEALLELHRSSRAAVTLALSNNYAVPVGVAEVKRNRVISFREKPDLKLHVTMGCLAISKSCIPVLRECTAAGGNVDVMSHFVPAVIKRRMKVVPFYLQGFWYDVGTTEAYEKLDPAQVEKTFGFLE